MSPLGAKKGVSRHVHDDKEIYRAMGGCMEHLRQKYAGELTRQNRTLVFQKTLSYKEMIDIIRSSCSRNEFDNAFYDDNPKIGKMRTIKPDGGVIKLVSDSPDGKSGDRIVLVSEIKRQGTNDQRKKEGLKPQSQGNAIERLGKNLTGIKAMFMQYPITPFVCFGHGCDFDWEDDNAFVKAKLVMLNEFYPINQVYVNKKDRGGEGKNQFSPVSMFFRNEEWTCEEMLTTLKIVGEASMAHYLY